MAADDAADAELVALQRIDEAASQLQKEGRYLQALEALERGLVLRQHMFGADSDEVWSACGIVAEMCNLLAMSYLQSGEFGMVLELLKKAEILTERDEAGRAVTFNNLACYYRRQGKLHAALTYLQRALRLEEKLTTVEHPADTHLNMCAVLSQLGRHTSALEHAQTALILIQEELTGGPGGVGSPPVHKADRIAVLVIAYHNVGVEQEFLKRDDAARSSYRKAVEVAERHLGSKHGVSITVRNSLIAAERAIAGRETRRATAAAALRKSRRNARSGGGTSADRTRRAPSPEAERNWGSVTGAYGDVSSMDPTRATGEQRKPRTAGATTGAAPDAPSPEPAAALNPAHVDLITPRAPPEAGDGDNAGNGSVLGSGDETLEGTAADEGSHGDSNTSPGRSSAPATGVSTETGYGGQVVGRGTSSREVRAAREADADPGSKEADDGTGPGDSEAREGGGSPSRVAPKLDLVAIGGGPASPSGMGSASAWQGSVDGRASTSSGRTPSAPYTDPARGKTLSDVSGRDRIRDATLKDVPVASPTDVSLATPKDGPVATPKERTAGGSFRLQPGAADSTLETHPVATPKKAALASPSSAAGRSSSRGVTSGSGRGETSSRGGPRQAGPMEGSIRPGSVHGDVAMSDPGAAADAKPAALREGERPTEHASPPGTESKTEGKTEGKDAPDEDEHVPSALGTEAEVRVASSAQASESWADGKGAAEEDDVGGDASHDETGAATVIVAGSDADSESTHGAGERKDVAVEEVATAAAVDESKHADVGDDADGKNVERGDDAPSSGSEAKADDSSDRAAEGRQVASEPTVPPAAAEEHSPASPSRGEASAADGGTADRDAPSVQS